MTVLPVVQAKFKVNESAAHWYYTVLFLTFVACCQELRKLQRYAKICMAYEIMPALHILCGNMWLLQ